MPSPELPYLDPAHAELYRMVEAAVPGIQAQLVAQDLADNKEPLHMQSICDVSSFLVSKALSSEGYATTLIKNVSPQDVYLHYLSRVVTKEHAYLIDATYGQFLARFSIEASRLPETCLIFPDDQASADMVTDWMVEIVKQRWRGYKIAPRDHGPLSIPVSPSYLKRVIGRNYQLSRFGPPTQADLESIAQAVRPNLTAAKPPPYPSPSPTFPIAGASQQAL